MKKWGIEWNNEVLSGKRVSIRKGMNEYWEGIKNKNLRMTLEKL